MLAQIIAWPVCLHSRPLHLLPLQPHPPSLPPFSLRPPPTVFRSPEKHKAKPQQWFSPRNLRVTSNEHAHGFPHPSPLTHVLTKSSSSLMASSVTDLISMIRTMSYRRRTWHEDESTVLLLRTLRWKTAESGCHTYDRRRRRRRVGEIRCDDDD